MMVTLTALMIKMTMIMIGLHLQLVKLVQICFQIYQGKSRLAIHRFICSGPSLN